MREFTQELENKYLSKYAALSAKSKGRERHEEPCALRTDFQRDRDRILHCKSFRRLKHKTQVFLAPAGDHYRTRLTHTLEVAQISRTISRSLRLNEDLTEAIALGHDLGHTPFGHAGERTLARISGTDFSHNRQSLRIVEVLEGGSGLNLTWEVRDGILNHTLSGNPATCEGKVVSWADRIAYINHDIDDAIRAEIITEEDLPRELVEILGNTSSKRINTMVRDIVFTSQDSPDITMSGEILDATLRLRQYLFDNIYVKSAAKTEEKKAEHILSELYEYFISNIADLPEEYKRNIDLYGEEQVVCDYLAGMTDTYALDVFSSLFIPSPWSKR
ncbi:MAG TPA: deoxyguanosinetriphosphate triphosphohydrolase [Clostridia bacterium]|nr:deoxyguanosinetriphosphate triphosphohydrolase [Clostridia bacterium]